jgi:hypothetical protein
MGTSNGGRYQSARLNMTQTRQLQTWMQVIVIRFLVLGLGSLPWNREKQIIDADQRAVVQPERFSRTGVDKQMSGVEKC